MQSEEDKTTLELKEAELAEILLENGLITQEQYSAINVEDKEELEEEIEKASKKITIAKKILIALMQKMQEKVNKILKDYEPIDNDEIQKKIKEITITILIKENKENEIFDNFCSLFEKILYHSEIKDPEEFNKEFSRKFNENINDKNEDFKKFNKEFINRFNKWINTKKRKNKKKEEEIKEEIKTEEKEKEKEIITEKSKPTEIKEENENKTKEEEKQEQKPKEIKVEEKKVENKIKTKSKKLNKKSFKEINFEQIIKYCTDRGTVDFKECVSMIEKKYYNFRNKEQELLLKIIKKQKLKVKNLPKNIKIEQYDDKDGPFINQVKHFNIKNGRLKFSKNSSNLSNTKYF